MHTLALLHRYHVNIFYYKKTREKNENKNTHIHTHISTHTLTHSHAHTQTHTYVHTHTHTRNYLAISWTKSAARSISSHRSLTRRLGLPSSTVTRLHKICNGWWGGTSSINIIVLVL